LFLTKQGIATLKNYEKIVIQTDKDLVSMLSKIELNDFREMLNLIWENSNGINPKKENI